MGRAAGGVFNTTARSGSNAWHGSGVLVSKPGATTGTLYFAKKAGLENPPQYYHNWAGSLGGPIVKNKTFLWFSTDDYKQRSTRNNVLTLPTALERLGDFSQTRNANGQLVVIFDPLTTRTVNGVIVRDPFPGNMIPADQRGGQGDVDPDADAVIGSFPQRPGHARRRPAEPGDAEDRSAPVGSLDDDRDVCASTHQGAGSAFYGPFGSLPGDPGASLLYRTVNFFALNNIFVLNANTAVAAQDEFRMGSLTLNYGLRYEYEAGVREANNAFTVGFDRSADFPVQVPGMTLKGGLMYAGQNGYPTHQGQALNGVAPRGGFAWSVTNNQVIRGGYGFYGAPTQFSGVGETAMGRLGYTATTTYLSSTDGNRTPANSLSDPFPSGITPPQGNSLGLATGAGGVIDFVDQNSRPGQVQQYSIDYSREMKGSIAVSIGR